MSGTLRSVHCNFHGHFEVHEGQTADTTAPCRLQKHLPSLLSLSFPRKALPSRELTRVLAVLHSQENEQEHLPPLQVQSAYRGHCRLKQFHLVIPVRFLKRLNRLYQVQEHLPSRHTMQIIITQEYNAQMTLPELDGTGQHLPVNNSADSRRNSSEKTTFHALEEVN